MVFQLHTSLGPCVIITFALWCTTVSWNEVTILKIPYGLYETKVSLFVDQQTATQPFWHCAVGKRNFKWKAVSLSLKWAVHSFKASYKWSHQIKWKTYQMVLMWVLWSQRSKVLEEFSLMYYIMVIIDVRVDHGHARFVIISLTLYAL